MNAQDLLTQLISGLQDGFVCYLVVSFAWSAAGRLSAAVAAPASAVASTAAATAEAVAVAVDELPSLVELFAMADTLTAAVEDAALQVQAAPQPAAEAIVLPSIRKLKALAREAKIPRYGSMTQLQLWEALGLQS